MEDNGRTPDYSSVARTCSTSMVAVRNCPNCSRN